ncbi:2-dehydropantoate 2-reductase [Paenibacillus castaneae]|uniref:ketopantoate reductase family protein n=1 Tax=Paenibacillus castaneae TaxID=474957 RepID=UPI00141AC12F|nr:2-dehydropantoate 2-reductase [Paenibacillus castaneae]NIK75881.1 2-dehydropantoate 2-reductase [Paenibacillus castaneae]
MQFDIVGGGSIGLLYGARLAEAGAKVTIWTRSQEQAAVLQEQGIRLRDMDSANERLIKVNSLWSGLAVEEPVHPSSIEGETTRWVLLTVKQTDLTDELMRQLEWISKGSTSEAAAAIICLQNGIGHLERIQSWLPNMLLLAAVTTEGAKRIDLCSVQHTGNGELWLGEWAENERNPDDSFDIAQKMLISILQSAGFTTFLSNNMKNRIFNKLLINAVINPLTAIFDVTNGQLPNHPSRERLMRELYVETERVLLKAGLTLEKDGWQQIIEVCKHTCANVSSMLSDIRAGRSTEISAINGGVVGLAAKYKLQAPFNQAIIELVQALHPKPC